MPLHEPADVRGVSTYDGVLAAIEAQSSNDLGHPLLLLLCGEVSWKPEHCCKIQRFPHCQRLVQQIILQLHY